MINRSDKLKCKPKNVYPVTVKIILQVETIWVYLSDDECLGCSDAMNCPARV